MSRNQIVEDISVHQMGNKWCRFCRCCVFLWVRTILCNQCGSALLWCRNCRLRRFHQNQYCRNKHTHTLRNNNRENCRSTFFHFNPPIQGCWDLLFLWAGLCKPELTSSYTIINLFPAKEKMQRAHFPNQDNSCLLIINK